MHELRERVARVACKDLACKDLACKDQACKGCIQLQGPGEQEVACKDLASKGCVQMFKGHCMQGLRTRVACKGRCKVCVRGVVREGCVPGEHSRVVC